MKLSHQQKDAAVTWGVLIVLAIITATACIALCGCSGWKGIDLMVRPGGTLHNPDKPAQPAPNPAPAPPPQDDWAPPWFRRPPQPKPERTPRDEDHRPNPRTS